MTAASEISWGKYDGRSGPFFRGKIHFTQVAQPAFLDKVLEVITTTEGGTYDAINMYDRCILSVGLIQFCEAGMFGVSTLLGKCDEVNCTLQDALPSFPTMTPDDAGSVTFGKNPTGAYRFFWKGEEVSNKVLQQLVYLGGASGLETGWTAETTAHAKRIAAWFASLWEDTDYQTAQREYTKSKIPGFVMAQAKPIIFSDPQPSNWMQGLQAMYYSFAANLPLVAMKSLVVASQDPKWASASDQDKFSLAAYYLTYNSKISIYPQRYNAIIPRIMSLFELSGAPETAAQLGK